MLDTRMRDVWPSNYSVINRTLPFSSVSPTGEGKWLQEKERSYRKQLWCALSLSPRNECTGDSCETFLSVNLYLSGKFSYVKFWEFTSFEPDCQDSRKISCEENKLDFETSLIRQPPWQTCVLTFTSTSTIRATPTLPSLQTLTQPANPPFHHSTPRKTCPTPPAIIISLPSLPPSPLYFSYNYNILKLISIP